MGAQSRYSFRSPMGAAGGIVDLAPHEINAFVNGMETGQMSYGLGVVSGGQAGTVVVPGIPYNLAGDMVEDDCACKFLGVVTNNRTTEQLYRGNLVIHKGAGLGVMRWGRIFVRIVPAMGLRNNMISYFDPVYLVPQHCVVENVYGIPIECAGMFSNQPEVGDVKAVRINARYISSGDLFSDVAMIELYNQIQPACCSC